jgi:hypothetical protein
LRQQRKLEHRDLRVQKMGEEVPGFLASAAPRHHLKDRLLAEELKAVTAR